MSDEEKNVTKLPVRFKRTEAERTFVRPHEVGKKTCCHRRFIVDETAEKVECADCGEKLNPIWVINYLAGKESQWRYNGEKYREEMQRLSERSKTKCEHCGHMTRISRSKKR